MLHCICGTADYRLRGAENRNPHQECLQNPYVGLKVLRMRPLRKEVSVSICLLLLILDLPWPSAFLLRFVRLLFIPLLLSLQLPVPVTNVSSSQSSQTTLLSFVSCYVRETTECFLFPPEKSLWIRLQLT